MEFKIDNVYKTVEGVFNGVHMRGAGDKVYAIPGNYASKSRLVEGDQLKLLILNDGTLIFKQIDLIPRVRFIGIVEDNEGTWILRNPRTSQEYSVISSSFAFFKLKLGDEVAAITSEGANWATIDSVIGTLEPEIEY